MAKMIVVTGKGGVGKTTVAALMVRHLKQHASGPVLAIDADPDANLGTMLGVEVHDTVGDVRERTLTEIRKLPSGMDKAAYIQAGLHETIVETKKVDFLVMGRGEGPGCYCYVNNLLREFSDKLLPSYQWAVMDSEAGMEHISRRTAASVDHLVVVIDAGPLAVGTARSIDAVASAVRNRVGARHLLINNVAHQKIPAVRARADGLGMTYLGHIPPDEAIDEMILSGGSLFDLGATPATKHIDQIMQRMGVSDGDC